MMMISTYSLRHDVQTIIHILPYCKMIVDCSFSSEVSLAAWNRGSHIKDNDAIYLIAVSWFCFFVLWVRVWWGLTCSWRYWHVEKSVFWGLVSCICVPEMFWLGSPLHISAPCTDTPQWTSNLTSVLQLAALSCGTNHQADSVSSAQALLTLTPILLWHGSFHW